MSALVHFYSPDDKRCLGEDNLCGGGDPVSYDYRIDNVTCPACLALLRPKSDQDDAVALAALKSYSKLAVLAERERICKLLEEMVAEIRRES